MTSPPERNDRGPRAAGSPPGVYGPRDSTYGAVPDGGAGTQAPSSEQQPLPVADEELAPTVEAVLMVVDEPISAKELADEFGIQAEQVAEILERLAQGYTADGRGFELRQVAGSWRMYSRARYAPAVERFLIGGRQARLTQAALETLAVIAYRQPVSRRRIAAVRGVNVDGVVRTLTARGLIEEVGSEPSGAVLYATTRAFLERLGLSSIDELPDLAPYLPEASELDEVAASIGAADARPFQESNPAEEPSGGEQDPTEESSGGIAGVEES